MRPAKRAGCATALALCGLAVPVGAQTLGGAQTPDVSLLRVALALVFCILIAVTAAYVMRFRMTGRFDLPKFTPGAARRLVLVERLRLGAQHELCLITLDGREFMVSVSAAGIVRFDGFGEAGTAGGL